MRRLLLLGFIWFHFCECATAEVLTNGFPMTVAITTMKKSGYKETGLDMMSRPGSGMELRFWGVGDGVPIVSYSKTSQKISRMTFWFADERPKSTRQTFEFDVASFDADTGVMMIRTKKGEP